MIQTIIAIIMFIFGIFYLGGSLAVIIVNYKNIPKQGFQLRFIYNPIIIGIGVLCIIFSSISLIICKIERNKQKIEYRLVNKELYEKVQGEPLPPINYAVIMGRIEQNIVNSINSFNLEPQR